MDEVACWKAGPKRDGVETVCVLPDGHAGPHEWTREDAIVLAIPPVLPLAETIAEA